MDVLSKIGFPLHFEQQVPHWKKEQAASPFVFVDVLLMFYMFFCLVAVKICFCVTSKNVLFQWSTNLKILPQMLTSSPWLQAVVAIEVHGHKDLTPEAGWSAEKKF